MNKKRLITCAALALSITLVAGSGALRRPDKWLQDTLFQTPSVASGDIVIIGIDEDSFKQFGPYTSWDRNIMASALEALAADPDQRPAVVAIDTLYAGTTDPAADAHLAAAAAELGNVVTATAGEFGTTHSFGDDSVEIDNYAVVNYSEPYDDLKDVTYQGQINAMYDTDGIMRHALLYIELPSGERVMSMPYTAASIFSGETDSLMPPTNARGQFYIPYTSLPTGFYDDVSIADLINGEVDPSYYSGKIVLIGPYATALNDSYYTPIDRAKQMNGVEIQANIIQSMLEHNFRTEAPDWPQLAILFAVSFVIAYIFLKQKVKITSVIAVGTIALSIFLSTVLYNEGFVTHVLWLPFGVLVIYVADIAYNYVTAALERQKVKKTFERYVAPNIVSEILKEGTNNLSLGGKLCDIAVLFVDVRGFTTMSERLDPQKIVFILNKYLTMTSNVIENNNGTLDKFVGDATMAFWGAPLEQEDPVYYAAKAALEIVEGAARVSDELKNEIGEELRVGVGVHFGPAVVGNMGSEKHMDYTAIGDTVNTSARLEANAPGGTVYISRVVAEKLGDRAKFTSLGDSIKLKGKAEGFEVLKLESLSGR